MQLVAWPSGRVPGDLLVGLHRLRVVPLVGVAAPSTSGLFGRSIVWPRATTPRPACHCSLPTRRPRPRRLLCPTMWPFATVCRGWPAAPVVFERLLAWCSSCRMRRGRRLPAFLCVIRLVELPLLFSFSYDPCLSSGSGSTQDCPQDGHATSVGPGDCCSGDPSIPPMVAPAMGG